MNGVVDLDEPQCPARHFGFGRCHYVIHPGDTHWIEDRFTPGRGVTFVQQVTDEQKAAAVAEWEAEQSSLPSDGPAKRTTCGAGMDGDCYAGGCPQNRDGEPMKSGRFCPLPPTGQIALREQDASSLSSAVQNGDDRG